MLDDELLSEFAHRFLGYGCLAAPWWFVGMEEGGGRTEPEVAKRLAAWQQLGGGQVVDLFEFHRQFGEERYWQARPPTQPTWRRLIHLKLVADSNSNAPVSLPEIRHYQRDVWGRSGHNAQTCLMELMPLPSPGIKDWNYDKWSTLPELQSRKHYRDWLLSSRIKALTQAIESHRPRLVVFYGLKYRDDWQKIAKVSFNAWPRADQNCLVGKTPQTNYIIIPHPTSKRSKRFWEDLGRQLAKELA